MNLVDLIRGQLTGDALARLGADAGASPEETGTAVSAAVPGLLSALAGLASHPEKLRALLAALLAPAPGLDEPDAGASLGPLLGETTLTALVGAVASFADVRPGVVRTLLGRLAPVVFAALAGRLKAEGDDVGGLARLLAEAAPAARNALPPGFSFLPPAAPAPASPPDGRKKRWKGLAVVAVLAAVGGGVWFLLNNQGEHGGGVVSETVVQPAERGPAATAKTPPPAKDAGAAPDARGLADSLTETYASATRELAAVRDTATADTALPRLQAVNSGLDTLKSAWDRLPESARSTVSSVTTERLPKLKAEVARVLAVPGVSAKLKPLLDALVERLAGLS